MSHPKSHITDQTSLTLIERVRARDESSWHGLVELYGPLVFSWCRRGGLGDEDAADAVQNVFTAVASNIATFRRDKPGDSFRGWLRVITRNQILMHFRRASTRPQPGVGGSTANLKIQQLPDNAIDDDEEHSADEQHGLFLRGLEVIRAEFEERTWQAFWQNVVEERPSDVVAQELGMSTGAIRQAKYKVLKRLRTELS